ncbi:MAG: flippase-like domain-containing protein [Acidimicrobiia bacterium]|nr:flippase-like domain-containing protein [Acidimicrobiia bacterium]
MLSSWPRLVELDPVWFVLMLAAESGSFVCVWALQRVALRTDDWFAVGASQLAGNAFSRVVPGGVAAGGALQFRMLSDAGVPTTTAVTGLTAVSLLQIATVLALPVLSLPAVLGGTPVNRGLAQAAWIGGGVFVLMFVLGAVLLTTDWPLRATGRATQQLRNRLRPHHAPIDDLPDRLVHERDLIRGALGSGWKEALLASVGKWGLDYLALVAALMAVGARPNPSLVLLAYVAAAVLSMIPFTPGGLGFVEAGLSATLTLAGVGAGHAVLATLAYRLVSYWLPLPAGLVAARLFRRRYPRRALRSGARSGPD